MTEAEWPACGEPEVVLKFLRVTVSDRKLRPFAVACRRVEGLAARPVVSAAVALAEAAAAGPAPPEEREAAEKGAFAVWRELRRPVGGRGSGPGCRGRRGLPAGGRRLRAGGGQQPGRRGGPA